MPDKYAHLHDQLEREGRYDEYTTPIHYNTVKPVDGSYIYLPRNPFFFIYRFLIDIVVFLFGPIVNFFAHGVIIKGRKNLRGVRSAITISNHVLYLDYLIIKQALTGTHRYYTTVAPHNCKQGLKGITMKAEGILPFGTTFTAQKHFNESIAKLLKRRTFVHFYPEQALWYRYEKPRPLKRGAFTFASVNNVPVIPILICFRKPWGIQKLFCKQKLVTVQICKPIYPNRELSAKENAEYLRSECTQALTLAYEAHYKRKLEMPPAYWERESKNETTKG